MYEVYLDNLLLPIAPSKISRKIGNQNTTMNLINNGEVSILKSAGLMEIDFEFLLPNVPYPFATYKQGFERPEFYLDKLKKLKDGAKPFQFKINRRFPDGGMIFDNDIRVSLEDYTIMDDVKEGFDVRVAIGLKEYRFYATTQVTASVVEDQTTITTSKDREEGNPPAQGSYTVVGGDCLWNIAKKIYGNGSKYTGIYQANKETIDKRNKGTGNAKYTIYVGQVLHIPAPTN